MRIRARRQRAVLLSVLQKERRMVSVYWILFLIFATLSKAHDDPTQRTVKIFNESGETLQLDWIHAVTGEMVFQDEILNGGLSFRDSFISHEFQLTEKPSKKNGYCGTNGKVCRTGYFRVSPNQKQAVFVEPGVKIRFEDTKVIAQNKASDLLTECQDLALETVGSSSVTPQSAIEDFGKCVEKSIASKVEKANEEITFQTSIRRDMAELLENYTCADYKLNTTKPKKTDKWTQRAVTRDVDIFLDRPASRVHVVKNFISDDECKAIEEIAEPLLGPATVADGSGGYTIQSVRKALQADIEVPWERERQGDPTARLARRVYDYVNHVLDLNIDEHGQQEMKSIQYVGRGEDDEAPDRYLPHCDGDCNGQKFKDGNRVATMVMYCTIPKKGGATNFKNAGVHIVPEKGSATFFSYIDPKTKIMDNGLTEHSGCPVIDGEKKIVTQWVRLGVTKETPYSAYNTLGVLKAEEN